MVNENQSRNVFNSYFSDGTLVFRNRDAEEQNVKAEQQLQTIDRSIAEAETAEQKYRLGLLRCRIAGTRDHNLLNLEFPNLERYDQMPGPMNSWVTTFLGRVNDISSLGNVVSIQNRYVRKNYLSKEAELRQKLPSCPPVGVQAWGTRDGARITWRNTEPEVRGYLVYRNGQKATVEPLAPTAHEFVDTFNGRASYSIAALRWDDQETAKSLAVTCQAGQADKTPPQIVVISPPTSAPAGQPIWIKARLLDNRAHYLQQATLFYRQWDVMDWTALPMERRVKAIFAAAIPAQGAGAGGLEYYIEATDGDSTSKFPSGAERSPLTLVVEAFPAGGKTLCAPTVSVNSKELSWLPIRNASFYRIYRSQQDSFPTGPGNFLTYVAGDAALNFTDNGEDFLSRPLNGTWYYKVTAVDQNGFESPSSAPVSSNW